MEAGYDILRAAGHPVPGPEVISCPTCGRTCIPVAAIANELQNRLKNSDKTLKIAVMGCVVNGPGEAREADLGVASGNGRGQIFVKGEVIKTVPEHAIVETLIEEAMKLAEGMEGPESSGEPRVTVG